VPLKLFPKKLTKRNIEFKDKSGIISKLQHIFISCESLNPTDNHVSLRRFDEETPHCVECAEGRGCGGFVAFDFSDA
jgi:hypothetical protein